MRTNVKQLRLKRGRILARTLFFRLGRRSLRPTRQKRCARAAGRALAFDRVAGDFALGTRGACMGTRLGAKYRQGGGGEKICLVFYSDKKGVSAEKNNATPTCVDADGDTRFGALTLYPPSPLPRIP